MRVGGKWPDLGLPVAGFPGPPSPTQADRVWVGFIPRFSFPWVGGLIWDFVLSLLTLEVSGVSERLAGISGEGLRAWRPLLPIMQRSLGAVSKKQRMLELL